MATKYPSSIDNNTTLPLAVDKVTGVAASSVNILQAAIIAIEAALGIKPQGVYTTVRARLDAIEAALTDATAGDFSAGGDLSGTHTSQTVIGIQNRPVNSAAPLPGQTLIWNGGDYSPSTDFIAQNITTSGSIVSGPILSTSLETGLLTTDGKFIINGITTSTLSNPGQAIIYYDTGTNKVKISENGGAYVNLLTVDAISWTQDLLGSTVSNQIVVGLTGSGGVTTIRSTSPTLQWQSTTISPTIKQADSSSDGYDLFISAQNAGGSNKSGGSLILSGGNKTGAGSDGYVSLYTGGTEIARTTDTQLNALVYGVGGVSGSVPTITTGTGAPSSTPANGSIYLRQDGYASDGLYIFEAGLWSPIGSEFSVTNVTSSYLVTLADNVIAVGTLSAPITITLPASPLTGQSIIVKDEAGDASTYNITVNGNSHNIDGSATIILNQNFVSVTLVYLGSSWGVI